MEVAFISSHGDTASASIWNPFTKSLIASYSGGGTCPPHGLCASSGWIISSEIKKPMLHAWPLNKQQKIHRRLIAPGKITCVSVSPDTNYIALSVDCKIHVYHTASGVLCGTGGNHFQPISVIRFNPEGTFIVCGGEDGLLTAWHLGNTVQLDHLSKKPFLSLNVHSLPITDLLITGGDLRSRIVTVSLDRSCKMHDIWTKDKLFGGHFENQLTAVALCPRESAFYIGDAEGQIREVSLLAPPKKSTNHYSNSTNDLLMSKFHNSKINCLSVSLDGTLILSGSNDETVKLIHIKSRQCLQTIPQKGHVTNCFFNVIPTNCFTGSFQPSFELYDFKSRDPNESNFSYEVFTHCNIQSNFDSNQDNFIPYESFNASSSQEIDKLKKINNDLYQFAVEKIMNDFHSHQPICNLEPEIDDIKETPKKEFKKERNNKKNYSSSVTKKKFKKERKNKKNYSSNMTKTKFKERKN